MILIKPILQVALDVLELDRAIQIASEAVDGGVDWIEAGTPLIKSEGMDAIRELRKNFKNVVLADMKTIDTGALEVEIAAKAGANIVMILGGASDSTILDAIRSARKYGVELMADIISVENPVKRAKELEKMGIDYINVHIGIDQQMTGQDAFNLLKEVSNEIKVPIAVAGGLDANSAKLGVGLGANIVIVGGNIVRSSNVTESARKIRESIDEASKSPMTELRPVKSRDEEIREIFLKVSTPNISDAMHRKGAMKNIKPLCNKVKLVGTAVTVQTFEGDWAKTVEAIDVAEEGDVIVIYAGGAQVAVWGELATLSCINKKISGVVIDGAVRDASEIIELQYPVFAKFITPNAGEPKGFGEINAEITCGGKTVQPGDYIIGDDNGVIVVPKERSYEIARRALEVEKNENRVREEIKRGRTLSEIVELYKWEKKR